MGTHRDVIGDTSSHHWGHSGMPLGTHRHIGMGTQRDAIGDTSSHRDGDTAGWGRIEMETHWDGDTSRWGHIAMSLGTHPDGGTSGWGCSNIETRRHDPKAKKYLQRANRVKLCPQAIDRFDGNQRSK